MGRLTEADKAKLARDLKPYIVPWLANLGGTGSGTAASALTQHDLNGPYHTGQLSPGQAPWAVSVTSFDAHITNADAHHARSHAITSTSDHTASGLTTGQVLRASGATTFAWAQLSHSDLGGVTANQHHNQQHSITGTDHTITASQWQVVGATATNTIGLLTPISTWAGAEALLKASSGGELALPIFTASTRVRSPLIDTASGNLTIQPVGDLILDPTDSNVLPGGSIQDDLGDYNRKWRTLYAAELYVETLVAQDVLSTIGGRILVAPTTTLIADVSAGATTIDVKHNNLASAYVMLQTAPGGIAQFEIMKVTGSASAITGGYRYSVTRNVDGSGANSWVSGDAVASLGASTGQGYIDLTSTSTVHGHLGPTVAIYSRTGTAAWNDTKAVVAQGNLRSFVSYSADEFGLAVGNDLTLQPTTGFKGFTADRTNGLQLYNTPIKHYNSSLIDVWIADHGMYLRTDEHGILAFASDLSSGANAESTEFGRIEASNVAGFNSFNITAWDDVPNSRSARLNLSAYGVGSGGLALISLTAGSGVDAISLSADTIGLTGTTTINGGTAWHSGNDGSGSGLDADTVDGSHASAFAYINGKAGGQTFYGGTGANEDLILHGTIDGTRTTSYIAMQPSGGYVGIGLSAPSRLLHLATGSHTIPTLVGGELMLIDANASGTNTDAFVNFLSSRNQGFRFGDAASAYAGYLAYGHGTDIMEFGVAGSTRITIDSSGNVLIGTASNTYSARVNVAGNIHSDSAITAENFLQVKTRSGSPGGASGWGRIYYDSGDDKLKYVSSGGTVRIISYT